MRLSREQLAAAGTLSGAVRVVAGAGTGKTAVIAERFRRLVEAGAAPESILVMTFSERAAEQMRSRILEQLEDPTPALSVGTFHALALSWLREDGWRVGVPRGFELLTGAERWILARDVMWELAQPALVGGERPDELVAPLLKLLERLKQELVPLERVEAWCRDAGEDERADYLAAAATLFRALGDRCRIRKLLDFDDLLVHSVRLLERTPEVRADYSRRFRHLMVDEYQDTNLAQERLVELLGSAAQSVFVVGDDDQSIYRFRGASKANMERFGRGFPQARTLSLGTNRRSGTDIVGAARALISQNTGRLPKPIRAARRGGCEVELWAHHDGSGEAAAIAGAVQALGAEFPLSETAVLVRTNALARSVTAALEQRGLPYRLRGALGFYERPEVKDAIAYLRLLRDGGDRVALARLLTRPPVQLRPPELVAVLTAPGPLIAVAALSPKAHAWAVILGALRAAAGRLGIDDLFFELMEQTRHLDALLLAATEPEGRRIAANLARFSELASEFCDRRSDHSLGAFLEHLELVLLSGVGEEVAEPDDESEDAVQIMTIHQAKGLEFEAVFVPAVVEGRLPQAVWRDGLELPAQVLEPSVRAREDHVAEERRLLYVAMTRARSRLRLSWAEHYEGSRAWRPSRFLGELAANRRATVRRSEEGPALPVPVSEPNGLEEGLVAASPAEDERLTLSFSGVAAYRECPRQYWYRSVLRLPAPASVEAQLGTTIHRTLMAAGALRRQGKALGPVALRRIYRRAWAEAGGGDQRRRPALEALGWGQLRAFLKGGGLDSRPYLVERSFTADLDGWTLRGIIDRVDPPPTQKGGEVGSDQGGEVGSDPVGELGSNQVEEVGSDPADRAPSGASRPATNGSADRAAWRLVDYKTGSPVPASRLRRDLQLSLYALGARHALGLDPIELEIVYLKTGAHVLLEADDELLAEARRIGDEVAAGVRAGHFEARPERRRCQLCPYRLACADAL
jgi:DNA helicase-2/ATP-dependent DNA helicase PcrA